MRRTFPILFLIILVVAVALAALSWLSGSGPVADALRLVAGSRQPALVSAEDVATCGHAWRLIDTPNPSATYSDLRAVTALSPNDVWAVGVSGRTEEFAQTMTLHWDGARWTHLPSPSVENYSNHVHAVSAAVEAWLEDVMLDSQS